MISTTRPAVDEIRFHSSTTSLLETVQDNTLTTDRTSSPISESVSSEGLAGISTRTAVQMYTMGATGLWGVDLVAKCTVSPALGSPLGGANDSEGGASTSNLGRTVTFPALVDTGAPTTVLNVAAAIALGLLPSQPSEAGAESQQAPTPPPSRLQQAAPGAPAKNASSCQSTCARLKQAWILHTMNHSDHHCEVDRKLYASMEVQDPIPARVAAAGSFAGASLAF